MTDDAGKAVDVPPFLSRVMQMAVGVMHVLLLLSAARGIVLRIP